MEKKQGENVGLLIPHVFWTVAYFHQKMEEQE